WKESEKQYEQQFTQLKTLFDQFFMLYENEKNCNHPKERIVSTFVWVSNSWNNLQISFKERLEFLQTCIIQPCQSGLQDCYDIVEQNLRKELNRLHILTQEMSDEIKLCTKRETVKRQ